MPWARLLGLSLTLGACSMTVMEPPEARSDAGMPDMGMPDTVLRDAGVPDAGVPDTGLRDAGVPDTGVPDARRRDAGTGRCPTAFTVHSGSTTWCLDQPEEGSTVCDDGAVFRLGSGGLLEIGNGAEPYFLELRLDDGAEGALRARAAIEATGVLEVPVGAYSSDDPCTGMGLSYHRGRRTWDWTIDGTSSTSPRAPAALVAAIGLAREVAARSRCWLDGRVHPIELCQLPLWP